jgi:cation:H+ antiporter
MIQPVILLIIGLAILLGGAEGMVRGSASIARRFDIPPLVIGLTIVAFGTSTPELLVNIYSAFNGSADLAVGNIIGSNIVNILLILGLSAAIAPLSVKRSTTWKEIPFALLGVLLVFVMGNDARFDSASFNGLTRTDGIAFLGFFAIFLYYIVELAKGESNNDDDIPTYSSFLSTALMTFGIAGLFWGGQLFVDNAVILARLAGLSESLIGLTVVAIGTSLPELATSVVASVRGHNDIAIGNVVGSNIFNIFWVLGLTSTILPLSFNISANIDLIVAIGATSLLFLTMFIGKKHKLERWQGVLFILLYITYLSYLIVRG